MVGGGDKCNCKGPYKWEAAELESERESVIMEAEVRGERLEDASCGLEGGGRGHKPRDAGSF